MRTRPRTNKKYAAIHNFGGDITIPAHERVIHFTTKKRGQITWSKPDAGDLFSKRKKASYAIERMIGAYAIRMPKREFLTLHELDLGTIRAKVAKVLPVPDIIGFCLKGQSFF